MLLVEGKAIHRIQSLIIAFSRDYSYVKILNKMPCNNMPFKKYKLDQINVQAIIKIILFTL